jgi:uracil-DNA glycosylase
LSRLQQPLAEALQHAEADWHSLIDDWTAGSDGRRVLSYVESQRHAGVEIYPSHVLKALELTPRHQVRVVIVGQDPYHGPGQAEGLAFSVPPDQPLPPSLRNIFKELQREFGEQPTSGHLAFWARQGVLLLNTSLTVERGRPASHAKIGWGVLTDGIIDAVAHDAGLKVFMLWGAHAQAKKPLILASGQPHLVLESNHPSPLSATRGPVPFIGNGHFEAANRFIAEHALGAPINWTG